MLNDGNHGSGVGDRPSRLPPQGHGPDVRVVLPSSPPLPPTALTVDLAMLALPEWSHGVSGPGELAWRNGYLWMRLGRYDHAFAWWDEPGASELRARTAGSRAAAYRELGRHDLAEVEDLDGLTHAADAVQDAAILVGLVADAVGNHDPLLASQRLDEATRAVGGLPRDVRSDRQRIRLGWVTAEVGLLTGRRMHVSLPSVDEHDEVVLPAVYHAGSRHHRAKGLLFRGVLDEDLRALELAARLAPRGLRWAVHAARAWFGVPDAERAAQRAWDQVVLPEGCVPRGVPSLA